jgi:hypothetical protein
MEGNELEQRALLLLSDLDAEGLDPFEDQIMLLTTAAAFRLAAPGLSRTDCVWHFRNSVLALANATQQQRRTTNE